jgi:phosphoserine phosphatase RsbU/P
LGDASGKGVAAGLVASAVQARVNAAARHAHLSPEALMAAVDRDVFASTEGARYATAIYAVLDARAATLTVVNAGHPAALILTTGGAVRLLNATGPALGLIEAGGFGSHVLTLDADSLFVAFTDGVSEAVNESGEEFAEARLVEIVAAARHHSAAQICATVLDTIRAYRGSRQDQDDVTVMVVKRGPRS